MYSVALPFSSQEYSATGWYFVDPAQLTDKSNPAKQYVSANAGTSLTGSNIIKEGVGTGFYFGPDGGGAQYDPVSTKPAKVDPTTTDNTVAKLDGATDPVVETVFNGNFQQGIKQSIFNHLLDPTADWGRFPLSYQLPGWSFQGGSGFEINTGALNTIPGLSGIPSQIDVTDLFIVPAKKAEDALTSLVNGYIDTGVDKVVAYIQTFYQNKIGSFSFPAAPADPQPFPTRPRSRRRSTHSTAGSRNLRRRAPSSPRSPVRSMPISGSRWAAWAPTSPPSCSRCSMR